jgi:hypothetical protein
VVLHVQRCRLARDAELAVVVLNGAVEEHSQKAAMDTAGRSLEDKRKRNRPRRPFACHTDGVLGKARIECPDVGSMVEVDTLSGPSVGAAPRRGIGRGSLSQFLLRSPSSRESEVAANRRRDRVRATVWGRGRLPKTHGSSGAEGVESLAMSSFIHPGNWVAAAH